MKYLIIGAGGTGGSIAASMTEAGLDVSVIARGEHLNAIKKSGITIEGTNRGTYTVTGVRAFDAADYHDSPDVILLCVKSYSAAELIPFIRERAKDGTVLIPLLNIYELGASLQKELKNLLVAEGCIYIAAEIKKAGVIRRRGDIFRVVFGQRENSERAAIFENIRDDFVKSSISTVLSDNIKRDAFRKYTFVSPMAACGQYYNIEASSMQKEGEERKTFINLVKELNSLARAMGIDFGIDIVSMNLSILDALSPSATASMQRDIRDGKSSEIDGLIYEAVRMGEKYNIAMPVYTKIAEKLKNIGNK